MGLSSFPLFRIFVALTLGILLAMANPVRAQIQEWSNAQEFIKQQKYSQALPLLESLNRSYPADPAMTYAYALCLTELSIQPEKAIQLLNGLGAHDFQPKHLAILGKAYLLNYQPSEAASYLERFVERASARELKETKAQEHLAAATFFSQRSQECMRPTATFVGEWRFPELGENLKTYLQQNLIPFHQTPISSELNFHLNLNSHFGRDLHLNDNQTKIFLEGSENGIFECLPNQQILNPIFMTDGKIRFAWNGPGGFGGFDLYEINYDSLAQSWSPPRNLGFPLNTPYDEILAFPALESYFLLVSNRSHSPESFSLYLINSQDTQLYQVPDSLLSDWAAFQYPEKKPITESDSVENSNSFPHEYVQQTKEQLTQIILKITQIRQQVLLEYLHRKKEIAQAELSFGSFRSEVERDSLEKKIALLKEQQLLVKERSNFLSDYLEQLNRRQDAVIQLESYIDSLSGNLDALNRAVDEFSLSMNDLIHPTKEILLYQKRIDQIDARLVSLNHSIEELKPKELILKNEYLQEIAEQEAARRELENMVKQLDYLITKLTHLQN